MPTHLLHLPGGASNFERVVTLDGVDYVLHVLWNDRVESWFMSISDINGVELIGARKLVTDVPLITHATVEGRPAGDLWLIDLSGQGVDPGLRDLDHRVRLMYVDEANVV